MILHESNEYLNESNSGTRYVNIFLSSFSFLHHAPLIVITDQHDYLCL